MIKRDSSFSSSAADTWLATKDILIQGGDTKGIDRSFGNQDNYDLNFLTNNTERLQIQNDGKIRIGGTGAPATTLEVQGDSAFNKAKGAVDTHVKGQSFDYLLYCKASTNRVGVGTNSPDDLFHLKDTTPNVVLEDDGDSCKSYVYHDGDSLQIAINRNPSDATFSNVSEAAAYLKMNAANNDSYITFWTKDVNNTAPTQRVIINKSGYVGIGVASPSKAVDVAGYIRFNTTKSFVEDGDRGIQLYIGDDIEFLTSDASNGYGFRWYGYDPGGGTYLKLAARQDAAAFSDIIEINDVGSVLMSAAAGGHQGAGTINAVAFYDDGVGPVDHVFDRYFGGKVRDEDIARGVPKDYKIPTVEEFFDSLESERKLPCMPSRLDFADENKKVSIGDRIDRLWEQVEHMAIYLYEIVNKGKQE